MARSLFFAALLPFLSFHVDAQQFQDYLQPYDSFGLSDACFEAVNTTLTTCPSWLVEHAGFSGASFDILPENALVSLCGGSCLSEMASLKTMISRACTQSTDIMVPPEGVAYPATFIIDRFLYAAELSCLKDLSSGKYCDLVVAPWMEQEAPYSRAQNCSDCELRTQMKQLSSPFGYDDKDATSFSQLTSSCGATAQYNYARPTSYALNATKVVVAQPTCTAGSYTVQDGDSCNLIAEKMSVSTESLITENGFDLSCSFFPAPGASICLPLTCKTRQLGLYDTCDTIVEEEGIKFGQLRAWNPIISPGCANLGSWTGRYLCVSPPHGTVTIPDGRAITAAPIPTNTQGESNTNCGQWYTITLDDTCATVSLAFGISLVDFYFLNPQVASPSCNNLWLGYSYCVKPVGSIETYSGYVIEGPTTSFTRPPVPPPTQNAIIPIAKDKPHAPGTLDGCFAYRDAWDDALIAGKFEFLNDCEHAAVLGGATLDQLLEWNPSLSDSNCRLDQRFSYCITEDYPDDWVEGPTTTSTTSKPGTTSKALPTTTTVSRTTTATTTTAPIPTTTTTSQTPPTTTTMPSNGINTPSPVQQGMVTNCNAFATVRPTTTCQGILDWNKLTLANFFKWNPSVGSDCSGLEKNTWACIGVIENSPPPSTTTTSAGNGVAVSAYMKTWLASQDDVNHAIYHTLT
ncbi:hypothetical protein F5X68DRAFT_207197 [Plectosphaerella plurivora]|uniref:LysM domain-containing protein n=1 Tax=Plectosphaerella plurivora TaxID=936078 RepID=A0A9P8VC46_9PEZI|nr:hypothetical protein F5X68DRAFT_207197 [Plectosphaerella plurivora]